MIENASERALAELRARFPEWHLWIVYRAVGPPTWNGQREGTLINEDSPVALAAAIQSADPQ